MARSLKVAAVQVESQNGKIAENLVHAEGFVRKAAGEGARLVVLPEFMPTGYIYTREIWDAAEAGEGPTMRWLRKLSGELGIWLGTSFLEAEGHEFYNTFVITDPEGREAGRVRKQTPACAEAYFFRGEAGSHLVETPLGKIGVGICYENQLAYTPRLMCANSADIMLMPHSAPSPEPNPLFPRKAVEGFESILAGLSTYYAAMLGIPVVMVNKSGVWRSPIPGLPFLKQDSRFPGLSSIADSDGTLLAQLGSEEGFIVAEVTLDPTRKVETVPAPQGRWAMEVPWAMNLWRLVEAIGGVSYKLSRERRERARRISSAAMVG